MPAIHRLCLVSSPGYFLTVTAIGIVFDVLFFWLLLVKSFLKVKILWMIFINPNLVVSEISMYTAFICTEPLQPLQLNIASRLLIVSYSSFNYSARAIFEEILRADHQDRKIDR